MRQHSAPHPLAERDHLKALRKVTLHPTVRHLLDDATPQPLFGLMRDSLTHTERKGEDKLSTAKLNIWITKRGNPCEIEDTIVHHVYVLKCNGEILEWCNKKKYVGIPTECGHVELEIPPGCYVVGAVDWMPANPAAPYLGNNLTHIAIVRANCGDDICVTLFDPSFHFCGTWFGSAANTILAGGGRNLPREFAAALKNAVPAMNALVRTIPPDPFVVAQAKALGTAPPPTGQTNPQMAATKGGAKKGRK
jgi:hypothetical protein